MWKEPRHSVTLAARCRVQQQWPNQTIEYASRQGSRHAYKVADEDIAAAMASGLKEDEVFEIVVCAVGQATRQYDTALAALEAAAGKE